VSHCVEQRVLTGLSCRPPYRVLLAYQWARVNKALRPISTTYIPSLKYCRLFTQKKGLQRWDGVDGGLRAPKDAPSPRYAHDKEVLDAILWRPDLIKIDCFVLQVVIFILQLSKFIFTLFLFYFYHLIDIVHIAC